MKIPVAVNAEQRLRASLPPAQEQLDAIWEALAGMKVPVPPKAQEILTQVAAINELRHKQSRELQKETP